MRFNKIFDFSKKKIKQIYLFFKKNQVASFLLVFGFFLVSFLLIYMTLPVLSSGDDHYFHFRFAEKMLQNGFFDSFRDFKSIYFTNVAQGQYFIYYNFLFYIVILPFTVVAPLFLAIKLYAVIIAALIGAIIYFFVKKVGIKYPFLWAVGFFAIIGPGSFWRLFLSRPYVFAPVFILLLILAMSRKKYFWIFFLTFLYLFWHTATFLLPIFTGIVYFVVIALYEKKYNWKLLISVVTGTLFAVIVVSLISKGFFDNIYYNVLDLLKNIFLSNKINISEGGELYPKNFFDFLNQNIFLFMTFLLATVFHVFVFFKERKNMFIIDNVLKQKRIITLAFLFLSLIFFIAIPNISNRFADFFVFFAWIFIALVFNEIFTSLEFRKPELKKFLKYAIFICLIYLFSNSLIQLNDSFASSGSRPETLRQVGEYLSKNLNKGDVVFNSDWSWFPQLYYYAPEQNYVIGLEPKMLYEYNSRLYWLWQNINKGYVCEFEECSTKTMEQNISFKNKELFSKWAKSEGTHISEIVTKDFKSHYILTSINYVALNSILENNKNFKKVLNSNNYFIYQIIDSKND
jgi:hypothetical protein